MEKTLWGGNGVPERWPSGFPKGPLWGKALVKVYTMFVAYILRSERDGTYYYGSTENLEKRLKEHNSGEVKYTKGHRPYLVHHVEMFDTRREAGQRERFFKSIDGYRWLREQGIIGGN